ncbi:MAG: glycosyltransferase family 61 protein [Cyanobacteria bacterium J06632_22]
MSFSTPLSFLSPVAKALSGTWTRRLLFEVKRATQATLQRLLSIWRRPLDRAETVAYLGDHVSLAHRPASLPVSTYRSPVQLGTELRLDVLNNSVLKNSALNSHSNNSSNNTLGESLLHFEPDYVWDITARGSIRQLALTRSGTPLVNGHLLLDVDYGTVAGFKDMPVTLRHQHYPVIIAPWSHFFGQYYTFVLWVLAKLCRMQAAIEPALWQRAKVCYPRFNTAYETQYLEKLGLPLENVIDTRTSRARLSTDRLILANNQTRVNRISPADVALLRQRFLPAQQAVAGRRLFFPRRGRRVLKNEAELRIVLEKYGFESIEDTPRSVDEQIALFQSAACIVAVHGAGLSNLVWCSAGTHVVELFYRGYTKPGFYYLCQLLGLQYDCLFDRSRVTDSFSNQFCDLEIDPTALAALLERAL